MAAKEAQARVKINKLLEVAGWRFFDDASGKANVALEPNVTLTHDAVDELGENFEKISKGFVDFLLLDMQGFPQVVLEAKAEHTQPLTAKEQARTYAKSLNCRFVILSNGNLHYFWDLKQGNPQQISSFPTPESLTSYVEFQPDGEKLAGEPVERDYIVRTQLPGYQDLAGWKNEAERSVFVEKNHLRFLREYQLRAVKALQAAVREGKSRFLFEMATGTGKTLTSAAVLKLFLRTSNARRVLFLVDRLELEDQAQKAFVRLLKNDYSTVIYKERRDDWRRAEIVVTTVQSLLTNNKYRTHFSPTDFDLVISDEAHRSISGDARAVFEYFVGYKLGLTATPRDYLKSFDSSAPTSRDPRELERRQLLDTYTTFGCESGEPTFRYSLLDGVTDGFLINPKVVDARTDITTKLLSEEGYAVVVARGEESEEGDAEETFFHRDFEKKFFSEPTNRMFCETFLRHALGDPISGELGKSLVFAVSQAHATKLTQMLNELAEVLFPGKYQSDFAVQVTSLIPGAQQYTINFANNNLLGSGNFIESYKTSKARVCVTVGMMTTGYDCPDILNLAMMRPIFSPSEFVQIKGRGTRKHTFTENLFDEELKAQIVSADAEKVAFKLFDFFGNCEYFEEKFNYDEIIELPRLPTGKVGTGAPPGPPLPSVGLYENHAPDPLKLIREEQVGLLGMKIDRMLFQKFEEMVKADTTLAEHVAAERWEQAVAYVSEKVLEKPTEHFTLEKLRTAVGVDRRLGLREILEKVFGRIARFKSKEELLAEEFEKFVLACKVEDVENLDALRYFFTAYLTDSHLRGILESKRLTELNTNPNFGIADYRAVPEPWRTRIPEYIKDYVSLNAFL